MDMERVREAALAYYRGLTEDQKQAAQRFFVAMDTDNSGNISIDEFMTFLTIAGFQSEKLGWLFMELDKDDNGTLDFNELLTFFYIVSRDEYRDLLNSRANTDVPRRKARSAGRTRWNWEDMFQLLNVIQGAYQLGQQMVQNGCSIL